VYNSCLISIFIVFNILVICILSLYSFVLLLLLLLLFFYWIPLFDIRPELDGVMAAPLLIMCIKLFNLHINCGVLMSVTFCCTL